MLRPTDLEPLAAARPTFDRLRRDALRRQPVRLVTHHPRHVKIEGPKRAPLTLVGDTRGEHVLVNPQLEWTIALPMRRVRRWPTARTRRHLLGRVLRATERTLRLPSEG